MIDASTYVNMWRKLVGMMASLPLVDPVDAGPDTGACCEPAAMSAMALEHAQRLAQMFKALGDPTRVRLLSMIAAQPEGEACVCDLTSPVGLSQPTVSHHMKQLVNAGLVTREQRGKWAYYALVEDALAMLGAELTPDSLRTPAAPASSRDGGFTSHARQA